MIKSFLRKTFIYIAFIFGCFFAFNYNVYAETLKDDIDFDLPGNIKELYFVNTTTVPETATKWLDLSESENESIMSWYIKDNDTNDIVLYIGSESRIDLSTNVLKDLKKLEILDLTNVNSPTDEVFIPYNVRTITINEDWEASFTSGRWKNNLGEVYNYCGLPKNIADTYNRVFYYYGINDDTLYISNVEQFYNINGEFNEYVDEEDTPWIENVDLIKKVVVGTSSTDKIRPLTMSGWFRDLTYVTSFNFNNVIFDDVVSTSYMFRNCTSLKTLDLSMFDTSLVVDMQHMFENCNSLEDLNLSSFNTSRVVLMNHMFYNCESLGELILTNFDTSEVMFMDSMFMGCTSLRELNLSSFITTKVVNMSHMFDNCINLETLNISSFDTSDVINMSYMFNSISKINSIDISHFNTSKVTNMSYMFYGSSFETINITGIDTSKVTNMNAMFYECVNLSSLDLSSFDTSSLSYYDHMLSLYTISVTVGNKWNIWLDFGKWINSAGETYDYKEIPKNVADTYSRLVIYWGVNNDTLYISNNQLSYEIGGPLSYDGNVNGEAPWERYNSVIKKVIVGTSSSDIVAPNNMKNWFSNLSEVTSYNFNYINTSNVSDMSYLFYENAKIETIDLSKFNTSKVVNMNNIFDGCYLLKNININNLNTSSVRNFSRMFANTQSLRELDISSLDMTSSKVKNEMFKDSGVVLVKVGDKASITLTNNTWENMTTNNVYEHGSIPAKTAGTYRIYKLYYKIDNKTLYITSEYHEDYTAVEGDGSNPAWNNNYDITKVVVGTSDYKVKPRTLYSWFLNCINVTEFNLTNLDTSLVESMFATFAGCSSVTSLDLSKFNTSNVTDMTAMFMSCESLTSIDLSKFNTSKVTNMSHMFQNCNNLKSLDLSKFDTSKVTNMYAMFVACSELTNVNLSSFDTSNVTNMDGMFAYMDKITNLDLSKFNTSKVTDMATMFMNDYSLKSLDISSFNTSKVTNMSNMFTGCSKLESLDFRNIVVNNKVDDLFIDCYELVLIVGDNNNNLTQYLNVVDKKNNKRTGRIANGDVIVSGSGNMVIGTTVIILGDVTCDGLVNISDVMKTATHSVKNDVITEDFALIAADVTKDGKINIADIMKIATYSVKGGKL